MAQKFRLIKGRKNFITLDLGEQLTELQNLREKVRLAEAARRSSARRQPDAYSSRRGRPLQ